MGEHCLGELHVKAGKEGAFITRWTEFLRWTRDAYPGLAEASLIRDRQNPRHFISFAEGQDVDAREGWKQSPGFMEKLDACRERCEDLYDGDCDG